MVKIMTMMILQRLEVRVVEVRVRMGVGGEAGRASFVCWVRGGWRRVHWVHVHPPWLRVHIIFLQYSLQLIAKDHLQLVIH